MSWCVNDNFLNWQRFWGLGLGCCNAQCDLWYVYICARIDVSQFWSPGFLCDQSKVDRCEEGVESPAMASSSRPPNRISKRVLFRWEKLVGQAISAAEARALKQNEDAGGNGASATDAAVPQSLLQRTNIDAILEMAEEFQREYPQVALICKCKFTSTHIECICSWREWACVSRTCHLGRGVHIGPCEGGGGSAIHHTQEYGKRPILLGPCQPLSHIRGGIRSSGYSTLSPNMKYLINTF